MKRLLVLIPFCFSLFNCGIDEYAYIYPVPRDGIVHDGATRATVPIPNNNSSTVFTNFIIMYRIYLSPLSIPIPQSGNYAEINSDLDSHYRAIDVYNDVSDRVFLTSYLDSLFINKGYKYLCFENFNSDDVLSSGILGGILEFDFSSNQVPSMTVSGGSLYTLLRSDQLGLPQHPQHNDSHFYNSSELLDPDATLNVDVNKNSKTQANPDVSNTFAYAAMFIIAVGLNAVEYSPIYSNPTLIHVFRLPNGTW